MKLYRFLAAINWIGWPHGYANGYVAVPPEHPLYEKHYDSVDLNVHGGLTYSDKYRNQFLDPEFLDGEVPEDYWVFGFDTCHWGDNLDNCDREYCINEVTHLKEQLEQWQNTI